MTEEFFGDLFTRVNDEFPKAEFPQVGACAVLVIVRVEEGKRVVYSANVGDSMAYIEQEGVAKKLSYWHHVDNEEEAA